MTGVESGEGETFANTLLYIMFALMTSKNKCMCDQIKLHLQKDEVLSQVMK